jgi:uncharacterized protein (TIGR03437 family)
MKLARFVVLLSAACGWHLAAQVPTFDNSGNGLLKGTYYFREVFYIVGDNSGDLQDALALYGNVAFSGSGTYTMVASVVDLAAQTLQNNLPFSGTYSISASGYGFISNPLSTVDAIFGLVSKQGIFIGSSTENNNGFNDVFIAAQLASPSPNNASFKGSYWVSDTDLSSGSPLGAISTLFQLNPDGAGNLGNVTLTGYVGQNGSGLITQTATTQGYVFTNGAAVVKFPNSTSLLVAGQKYLYISPDGSFVFGGSPTSADMFVGVRVASTTPSLSGLYYQAGVDEDDSQLASGFGNLDTYFGAFNAGGGSIVGHQRLADVFNTSSIDLTYSDAYAVKSDGTYSTPAMRYVVGAGGIRIGSGIGPFLGLNVALPAPSLSGAGVFLDPTGVVNAASSAPFTAGIAPGELLTLYGSGLSNDTQLEIAPVVPLPSTLAGVQVMINGVAAPLLYVSPTQISAIVPYSATTAVAQIQVINNGAPSNIVTNFTSRTAPGILTASQNGLGPGLVVHSDGTLVTETHPAVVGETVSVFLTGLGAVIPAVPDGSAAPTNPFSLVVNTITAFVGGIQASVGYSGLAPGEAALYQVNLTIPTGVTTGDNALDISGPDSYTSEAVIPVTTGSSAASPALAPAPLASRMRGSATPVRRPLGLPDGRRQ